MQANFLESLQKMPTAAEMRLWDQAAVKFGVPETMLMDNSAKAALDVAREFWQPLAGKTVWLFMGSGNNGGDAAAMARQLVDIGANAVIFSTKAKESLRGSPAWHLSLALANGATFIQLPMADTAMDFASFRDFCLNATMLPTLIVDALLGTGFTGLLKPAMRILIHNLNKLAANFQIPVLAMDIPSGLDADTGEPGPVAVHANVTITLQAPKPGLFLPPARDYVGKIICRPIGFPQAVLKAVPSGWRLLNGADLARQEPMPANSYKNLYGHCLVIGGAECYAGAAHVAAQAALRTGAGLVTVCAPNECLPGIKAGWAEIMTITAGEGGSWPKTLPQNLENISGKFDSLVIGPGMGRTENAAAFLAQLLNLPERPPAVIDADALVMLGQMPELAASITEKDVLTPHPGEAGKLLGLAACEVQNARAEALARLCSKYRAVTVLKGACTIVGQKDNLRLLCPYDIPQMAIGGAGDALAGCIGALLGSREFAACGSLALAGYGVLLHAAAGLYCSRQFPDRGALASELANAIAQARNFVANEAGCIRGQLPCPV